MDPALVLDLARWIIGGLVIGAGLVLNAGAAVGLLRFPDAYTRLHAASAADGPGAVLVLAGLAVVAEDWGVAMRLGLLAVLVGAAAPVFTHFTASAAHAAGLAPMTGDYKAPRPGAAKEGAA